MKTIELPDSLADALIATGRELAKQDNLGTAWPIWYVSEEKAVYTTRDGNWEHKRRQDPDYVDESHYCEDCLKIRDKFESDGIPDECASDLCDDETFEFYWLKRDFATYGSCFFLTQKACQRYIDANHYHFLNPKPFADSAFRNDELQPIIQALIIAAGEKVPDNHYGKVEE